MDAVLGLILDTLEDKQLTDVVNVIITSDHGMTSVNMERRVRSSVVSPVQTIYQRFLLPH